MEQKVEPSTDANRNEVDMWRVVTTKNGIEQLTKNGQILYNFPIAAHSAYRLFHRKYFAWIGGRLRHAD